MSSPTGTNKDLVGESKGASSKAHRTNAKTEPKSTVPSTPPVEPGTEETNAAAAQQVADQDGPEDTTRHDPASEETIAEQVADQDVAEDTTTHEDEEAKEGKSPTAEGNVINENNEDTASENSQEQEPKGSKAPIGNILEVTDASDKHILYPGGGHFNKLRKKQVFLNQLLDSCVDKYIDARNKREFVRDEVLVKIPGGLYVFDKNTGDLYTPNDLEAFERVAQKLRDIKKFRLNSIKRATAGSEGKPGRKPKKPTATIAAIEERKRKRDEELESKNAIIASLEAEVEALRKDNSEQKEELDKLKELVGANQADKRQRIQGEDSPEKGDSKTSGEHSDPEGTTVPV